MIEVALENLPKNVEEATVQVWYFEEGDAVNEGDDLCELSSEEGTVVIQAPSGGVLAEVYYDEGEAVSRGEVLCTLDDDESASETEDDES
jgi:pyruvate/2-oxoglutarate dehydrogenase complex dihydrolipoamide acyltransferase (E2) component